MKKQLKSKQVKIAIESYKKYVQKKKNERMLSWKQKRYVLEVRKHMKQNLWVRSREDFCQLK